MDAKELRIGNLIQCGNTIREIAGIMIKDGKITTHYSETKIKLEGEHSSLINDPIPITADWLERLGFVKAVDGPYRIDTDLHVWLEWVGLNGIWINCGETEFKISGLKHVHQLQNLYFALTGEELTVPK